jgi:choline dehydrogenase
LSEDPARRITLLESGRDDRAYDSSILKPSKAHEVWAGSPWVERYVMRQVDGPDLAMVAGRALGGTSAVNYLATVRGQPADYDRWAASGLSGWSWSDVQSTFVGCETDVDFPDSPIHGSAGPLVVRRWTRAEHASYQTAFIDGLERLGVPFTADLNDPSTLPGVGVFPATVDPVILDRLTVSRAYLKDTVRTRSNLVLRCGASVERILIEGSRAVGVRLGDGEEVRADQTIVAAGAFGSPALLLRSGVGSADQLGALGIDVAVDLPAVGTNYQDHIGAVLTYQLDEPAPLRGSPAQTVWVAAGSDGVDVHVFPTPLDSGEGGSTLFAVLVFLLRVSGRGELTLTTADPGVAPSIRAPSATASDLARLAPVLEVLAAWEQTPEFRSLGARRVHPTGSLDGPDATSIVWSGPRTSYGHQVGTCAMGADGDPRAVLDARCRLRGIEGLAVVDASAMPSIPAGNTYLGCVMMAERYAALAATP